jgi:hypothetical protein
MVSVPQLSIITIRDQLNEATFEKGRRRVGIGCATDLFAGLDGADRSRQLEELERELASHDLILLRGGDDGDELYVEQTLKHAAVDMSWMREAVTWTSRITTVALEMTIPAIAGMWADGRLGTNYLAILGLLLGVPLGIWHLIHMTRRQAG